MTIVLFQILTGAIIAEFDSEDTARREMREYNKMSGYDIVTNMHWENGIQMECTNKGAAPYGITEYHRWNLKYNPLNARRNNY